jgi:hypothetical protein
LRTRARCTQCRNCCPRKGKEKGKKGKKGKGKGEGTDSSPKRSDGLYLLSKKAAGNLALHGHLLSKKTTTKK